MTYTRLHGQEVTKPYFIPMSVGPKASDFASLPFRSIDIPKLSTNSHSILSLNSSFDLNLVKYPVFLI